ncbi:hypothetical protein MHLP_02395 [Candidatus Mycoplasma haematolamae str. Purdue]|uniref:Uncharacterized protein n=1 Tax=Mycoplasma haematolamae (strain Purdue) TaxID=1212765 RepID=I7CJM4_MYCHA|nr:hypothetical protein [Candidatus Mycoplasma haematolamae]AFO52059.1 hypothetical protein MHLP_02395 [Candidatus Mycoplasma haematolamae str. Purdue]
MHSFFKWFAYFSGLFTATSTITLPSFSRTAPQAEEKKKEKIEIQDPRTRTDISIIKDQAPPKPAEAKKK